MSRSLALLTLAVFAALAGPMDWRNWVLALPVAAVLAWAAIPEGDGRRLPGMPAYLLSTAWNFVLGTGRMLRLMLRRDPWSRHGHVLRRPEDRSPAGLALFSLAETSSPGTIASGIDPDSGAVIVHDIDASGQPPAPEPTQEEATRP